MIRCGVDLTDRVLFVLLDKICAFAGNPLKKSQTQISTQLEKQEILLITDIIMEIMENANKFTILMKSAKIKAGKEAASVCHTMPY
ncbi:MAG: hypothetical protein ACRCUY_08525 [Thermoguttaceae bacterium]